MLPFLKNFCIYVLPFLKGLRNFEKKRGIQAPGTKKREREGDKERERESRGRREREREREKRETE